MYCSMVRMDLESTNTQQHGLWTNPVSILFIFLRRSTRLISLSSWANLGTMKIKIKQFSGSIATSHTTINMWNLRVLPPGAFGLKMGVARGSVLGPLLFMRYVDDMHTVSSKFTFCTYADDTTLTGPMVSFVFVSIYIIHPISKGIDNKIKK